MTEKDLAKAALQKIVEKYNEEQGDYDIGYDHINYDRLIEIGHTAVDGHASVGHHMDLRDEGYLDDEFWKNWSIITGKSIPFVKDEDGKDGELPFFRCSC